MNSINEVNIDQVAALSDLQLTQLMGSLIKIELGKYGIPVNAFVPLNITTADGGEDGRVEWAGAINKTKWLPKQFCLFQNKATELGPKACYDEVLEVQKSGHPLRLKSQVQEVVDRDGCYILFTNFPMNKTMKYERVKNIRKAIKDSGNVGYGTMQIEVYDSNSIKDWVNENVATVTKVQSFINISRPGFVPWSQLENILQGSKVPYKKNNAISAYIQTIRDTMNNGKVIRIIGQSGLGKTRLVLEAFRSNDKKDNTQFLQNQFVYFEIGINGPLSVLVNYVNSHENQEGILVIDSCGEQEHRALSGLINSIGKFKLITIDAVSSTSEESYVKLERNEQKDIVKAIVNERIGESHSPADVDYLSNISEGYPWMAVRFCDTVVKEGLDNFNGILPSEFIKRLLFGGGGEDNEEYRIIRACAVFSAFGFLSDDLRTILNGKAQSLLEEQMNYIRIKICDYNVTESLFYEVCTKYKSLDIIERRGVYLVVKPTALAINLAADWLKNTPPNRVIGILEELRDTELGKKLVERLRDLDQIDEAQQIVAELWGPDRPFGVAEVLNTSWGALLFRYVVEVNPKVTMRALQNAFGQADKDQIRNIDAGRRNLVWALEKLCFRKETFGAAARLLYKFAVSENETWANNSTQQFIQLYQVLLAGTEVDFDARLNVLKWGLDKNDDDYTKIAVMAMRRGLSYGTLHRLAGAENQGASAPIKDFKPTDGMIGNYWAELVHLLVDTSKDRPSVSDFALSVLAKSMRVLIKYGYVDLVAHAINSVLEFHKEFWPEAIDILKQSINFEYIGGYQLDVVNQLIKSLSPSDVPAHLLSNVIRPEWDSLKKDSKGEYIDSPKNRAEDYAKVFVLLDNWLDYVGMLVKGEQRQSFAFGKKIGEIVENKKDIARYILDAIRHVEEDEQNPDLLVGFVVGSGSRELVDYIIGLMLGDERNNRHIFYLLKSYGVSVKDFDMLFSLVDSGLSVSYFLNFQYGRSLDNLSMEEVMILCARISGYGDIGLWTAFSILYMYCHGESSKWNSVREVVKSYVIRMNVAQEENFRKELYQWSDAIESIIREHDEPGFASEIAHKIVDICASDDFAYSYDTYIKSILRPLFDNYFDLAWPIIGQGLIGEYIIYWNLKYILAGKNGYGSSEGYLFANESRCEDILNWCNRFPEVAPIRIASIMPISVSTDTGVEWHPFALRIIDNFGSNQKVLDEIAANMGSFGMVGSSVGYYKGQRELLAKLLNHHIYEVVEWAEKMIDYTDKQIKIERLNDEHTFLM